MRYQFFAGGQPLEQVPTAADLKAGSFWLDAANKFVYVWAPSGAAPADVEGTKTEQPLVSTNGKDELLIRGLTFRHTAAFGGGNDAGLLRVGANGDDASNNVTVDSCKFLHAATYGLTVHNGNGNVVTGCEMSDNTQGGFHSAGTKNLVLRNSKWFRNNRIPGKKFDHGWDAVFKISGSAGAVIEDNEAAYNNGFAIWADGNNTNWTVRGNRVHDNGLFDKGDPVRSNVEGVRWELSQGPAYIYNNLVYRNGKGIVVSAGSNAHVFNNTVYRNGMECIQVGDHRVWKKKVDGADAVLGTQYATSNKVYNNVLVDNGWASQYSLHFAVDLADHADSYYPYGNPTDGASKKNLTDHNLFLITPAHPGNSKLDRFFGVPRRTPGKTLADWRAYAAARGRPDIDAHSAWGLDPKFADPGAFDFRTPTNTPVAGNGAYHADTPADGMKDIDITGAARPAGSVDLGAYERLTPPAGETSEGARRTGR
jgi:parallel beta-helix repeat protein